MSDQPHWTDQFFPDKDGQYPSPPPSQQPRPFYERSPYPAGQPTPDASYYSQDLPPGIVAASPYPQNPFQVQARPSPDPRLHVPSLLPSGCLPGQQPSSNYSTPAHVAQPAFRPPESTGLSQSSATQHLVLPDSTAHRRTRSSSSSSHVVGPKSRVTKPPTKGSSARSGGSLFSGFAGGATSNSTTGFRGNPSTREQLVEQLEKKRKDLDDVQSLALHQKRVLPDREKARDEWKDAKPADEEGKKKRLKILRDFYSYRSKHMDTLQRLEDARRDVEAAEAALRQWDEDTAEHEGC